METPPPLPPMPGPPPPMSLARPSGNDRLWSVLCHLSWVLGIGYFVVPLIIYLVMNGESKYVGDNAREALNFHISVFLYSLCCIPLVLVLGLGFFMLILIGIGFMIFSIVAAVKASEGGCYHYPLTIRLIQ